MKSKLYKLAMPIEFPRVCTLEGNDTSETAERVWSLDETAMSLADGVGGLRLKRRD